MVGDELRRLRLRHRLSQEKVATQVGLEPESLNDVENGGRCLSSPLLKKVLEIYKAPQRYDRLLEEFRGEREVWAERLNLLSDPKLKERALKLYWSLDA